MARLNNYNNGGGCLPIKSSENVPIKFKEYVCTRMVGENKLPLAYKDGFTATCLVHANKKKEGFNNHDRDLCTRRQAPINFKSKSKQNR
jgi:hypothetical protein